MRAGGAGVRQRELRLAWLRRRRMRRRERRGCRAARHPQAVYLPRSQMKQLVVSEMEALMGEEERGVGIHMPGVEAAGRGGGAHCGGGAPPPHPHPSAALPAQPSHTHLGHTLRTQSHWRG